MLIMPLVQSSDETIVLAFVFLVWFLSETIGTGIIPALRRRRGNIRLKENRSNIAMRVLTYLSIVLAIALALMGIAVLPDVFFYPGAALVLIGIVIRQWSVLVLGGFFTTTITVQKNQRVVDSGPYRYVRHPAYLGMFLSLIGLGFSLLSWAAVLEILVVFGVAVGYRIRIEEKVLLAEFGEEYIQYMKRTKRLIPFIF